MTILYDIKPSAIFSHPDSRYTRLDYRIKSWYLDNMHIQHDPKKTYNYRNFTILKNITIRLSYGSIVIHVDYLC